jgi:copper chaperone CopZ
VQAILEKVKDAELAKAGQDPDKQTALWKAGTISIHAMGDDAKHCVNAVSSNLKGIKVLCLRVLAGANPASREFRGIHHSSMGALISTMTGRAARVPYSRIDIVASNCQNDGLKLAAMQSQFTKMTRAMDDVVGQLKNVPGMDMERPIRLIKEIKVDSAY